MVFTPNPNNLKFSSYGFKQYFCAHARYIVLLDRFSSKFKTQLSLKCDHNFFHGFDNDSLKSILGKECDVQRLI